jgi:hypothetical protein
VTRHIIGYKNPAPNAAAPMVPHATDFSRWTPVYEGERVIAPDPRLERLLAAATECADDLETEVNARWGNERLAQRDLGPVVEFRAAFDAFLTPDPGPIGEAK